MRLKELDSLRGIAIILVILFHYTTRYSISFEAVETISLINFKYGGSGVSLFFMISGFVIYLSILKVKNAKSFFLKRFVRLYPTFWICMLITFIVMNLSPISKYHRTIPDLLVNITMVPQIFGFDRIDGVYWSLLPELMFYIMIGSLLFFNRINYIINICFLWLVLIIANNFYDVMPLRIFFNLKYGYFFIMGIAFYNLKNNIKTSVNHLLIFLSFITYIYCNGFSIKSFYILTYILLFYLFVYDKLKWISVKFLIYFGKISYPLYLTHQFIGYYIIYSLLELNIHNPFILFVIPLLVTGLLSHFVVYHLEIHIIKYLKKY